MPVVDVNSNDSDSNSNYVRNGQADNGDGEAGREDVQVPPQHQPFLFRCKIQNVRILVTVLRAISFRTKALCCLTPQGIKFTVEDSKAVQAHAYLQSHLFQSYEFFGDGEEEATAFILDLETFVDCLTIFGGSSSSESSHKNARPVSASMTYSPEMGKLVLTLSDNGIVTICRITTYDPEPMSELDTSFRACPMASKIIINSEWIKDAFSELDNSSEKLTFLVSPQEPFFQLSASSISGDTQMEYPKVNDILESFQCNSVQRHSYKFSLLQPALKALSLSSKTNLRMNSKGFLSMQYMIPVSDNQNSFVEFLWAPLVDDDEDGQQGQHPENDDY